MQKLTLLLTLILLTLTGQVSAATYTIDTQGSHAFIQFRVKHLGFSWLYGRFDKFEGSFSWDEKNPTASTVNITVDTTSLNSNHAERDKHIKSDDFLDVKKFPQATFVSTSFDGKTLTGDLTIHGKTKQVSMQVENIGGGKDPWGNYRQGFSATLKLNAEDFGVNTYKQSLELMIDFEGIRNK